MRGFSRWFSSGAAVMLAVHALGSSVLASGGAAAPEISPTSISAGVALLGGGVLMLRARRGSK
jgi:hypothetical protein